MAGGMAGRITTITTIIIRPLRPVWHRMVLMAVPLAMRPGTGRTPPARRRMADFPIWVLRMAGSTGLPRRAGTFMAGIPVMAHAAEFL